MIRLEHSESLGRKIRKDSLEELRIPTWTLVREAIREGKAEEAIRFLDYACWEAKSAHDSLCSFIDDVMTHLAEVNEELIYEVLRKRYDSVIRRWFSETLSVEESIQRCTEWQRGHGANCTITEEPERYVIKCNPCGSGGQLRRIKDVGKMKKAYNWTWGKIGVPYYCVHCCIMWEVIPGEFRGYPIRINLVGEKAQDPCVHLYYKKPELIPREYFERIGLKKP